MLKEENKDNTKPIILYKTTRMVQKVKFTEADIKALEDYINSEYPSANIKIDNWKREGYESKKEYLLYILSEFLCGDDKVLKIHLSKKIKSDSTHYYDNYDDAYDEMEFGSH